MARPSTASKAKRRLLGSPVVEEGNECKEVEDVLQDCSEEYVVLANTRALFNQISGMKCKGDTCGGSYRGRSIKVARNHDFRNHKHGCF